VYILIRAQYILSAKVCDFGVLSEEFGVDVPEVSEDVTN
jgi:hypothetical protein